MVNSLGSSIINYKVIYKSAFTENYVQSDNNKEDNEMFFTNCRYQSEKPMCGWYTGANSSLSCLLYWPMTFKLIKKCFVYRKISCWSTNHIQQKNNDLKKKFGDRHPKYKIRPNYE